MDNFFYSTNKSLNMTPIDLERGFWIKMFVFGEAKGKVINGRLVLPKEFHLKNKKLHGKWSDENTLYISDDVNSVNYVAGKLKKLMNVSIDKYNAFSIQSEFEKYNVNITGSITVIELKFFIQ